MIAARRMTGLNMSIDGQSPLIAALHYTLKQHLEAAA